VFRRCSGGILAVFWRYSGGVPAVFRRYSRSLPEVCSSEGKASVEENIFVNLLDKLMVNTIIIININ
jgi:hypothetical protein